MVDQADSPGLTASDALEIAERTLPQRENKPEVHVQSSALRKGLDGEHEKVNRELLHGNAKQGSREPAARTTRERQRRRRGAPHRSHRGYDVRSRQDRGRSRQPWSEERPRQQEKRGGNQKKEIQVMTWNVGGMPKDRMAEMVELLPAVGLGRVEVLALEEVSCPPGIMELTAGKGQNKWHIVAGKKGTEWRGRMIAVRDSLGKIVHKQMEDNSIAVTIRTPQKKAGGTECAPSTQSHPDGYG